MLRVLALTIALAAAARSPPANEAPKSDMAPMSETAPTAAGPITGVGVVTAVDAAAGTISLDHEPIAAISWPAMSMQFNAENPAILQGIAVGDRVSFELKSAAESSTITSIRKE